MTLADLKLGTKAKVAEVKTAGTVRRRMLDLGLTPGTEITAVLAAPGGDPRAYALRGTIIAFRRAQARQVLLRPETRG
ncbi:MAG: ferrous iron transport protein A [Firmicutes bacterium]|nr:ferrous iron transport protein A [Bacillota bacterium]